MTEHSHKTLNEEYEPDDGHALIDYEYADGEGPTLAGVGWLLIPSVVLLSGAVLFSIFR